MEPIELVCLSYEYQLFWVTSLHLYQFLKLQSSFSRSNFKLWITHNAFKNNLLRWITPLFLNFGGTLLYTLFFHTSLFLHLDFQVCSILVSSSISLRHSSSVFPFSLTTINNYCVIQFNNCVEFLLITCPAQFRRCAFI